MKAAVLHEVNQPLVIEDVSLQKPGPREVLIRTSVAGLCHSDLHFMEGLYPHPLPAVLGHESAGVVEQVGSDVTYVKPGDHVVTCLSVFCGTCDNCSTGRPVLCTDTTVKMLPGVSNRLSWARSEKLNQFLNLSSFAEQMLVHENAIVKIRKDMPLDLAALIGCGVITGYGAVVNTAKVAPGETVVVIGCGGVGIAAIQGARLSGAAVIVAVDPVETKHETAKRFGATHAVSPGQLGEVRAELTGGEGFDYAFEVVGLPSTIRSAWDAARRGGTVIIVGAGRGDHTVEFNPFELFFDGKTMHGSLYGSADVRRDFPRLIALWQAGRLDLAGMITQRVTLDQADDALSALGRGDIIRQVIVYD